MIVLFMTIFSVAVMAISYMVGTAKPADEGKLSTVITLVAWSSLLAGFVLSRLSL